MCHRYLRPRRSLLLLPNFPSSFPLIVPPGYREPTPCLAAHPTNHPRDLRSRETIASCAKIDAIWASTRCIVHTHTRDRRKIASILFLLYQRFPLFARRFSLFLRIFLLFSSFRGKLGNRENGGGRCHRFCDVGAFFDRNW